MARVQRPIAAVPGGSLSSGIRAENHRRKPTPSSRGHQPVNEGRRFAPTACGGRGRGEPHRHQHYTRITLMRSGPPGPHCGALSAHTLPVCEAGLAGSTGFAMGVQVSKRGTRASDGRAPNPNSSAEARRRRPIPDRGRMNERPERSAGSHVTRACGLMFCHRQALVRLLGIVAVSLPRGATTTRAFFLRSAIRFICCSARLWWRGAARRS